MGNVPWTGCKLGWSMDVTKAKSGWGLSYCACRLAPSVWATVHVELHNQSELLWMLTCTISLSYHECWIALSVWATVHVELYHLSELLCMLNCKISLSYCACWLAPSVWATVHVDLHHQSELLCMLTCTISLSYRACWPAPSVWATVHVDLHHQSELPCMLTCTISLSYRACWLAPSVWSGVHVDLHHQCEVVCMLTATLVSSTVHFNCIISSYYHRLLALWRGLHQQCVWKGWQRLRFCGTLNNSFTLETFRYSTIQFLMSSAALVLSLVYAILMFRQFTLPTYLWWKSCDKTSPNSSLPH